jgi:hypothetical protein
MSNMNSSKLGGCAAFAAAGASGLLQTGATRVPGTRRWLSVAVTSAAASSAQSASAHARHWHAHAQRGLQV